VNVRLQVIKDARMTSEVLVISSRFCGPPKSGNGGYVCGRVAAHIRGAASVRLKAPPPLEVEMQIQVSESGARLMHGSNVIAEAKAATLNLTPPPAPSFAQAEEAASTYLGFIRHVFPRCFVCGPQRAIGDGLRIFPGSTASGSMVAAPWVPDPSLGDGSNVVRAEFLWAALDCTSGFAVLPIPEGKAIVLGELSARIDDNVVPGEKCVVIGWPLQIDGRKRISGSAVVSSSGRLSAVGRATWIEVQASEFGGQ
jgi:hypothetical protein